MPFTSGPAVEFPSHSDVTVLLIDCTQVFRRSVPPGNQTPAGNVRKSCQLNLSARLENPVESIQAEYPGLACSSVVKQPMLLMIDRPL